MAGISWPALTSGSKAKASEVELKFDWLEGHIVPMLGGSKTNGVYDLGETAYHFNNAYINNLPSTTSINVNSLTAQILKAGTSANMTNTTIGILTVTNLTVADSSVTSENVNSLTAQILKAGTSANLTNTTIGNLSVTSENVNSLTAQILKAGTSANMTNTTIGILTVTNLTVADSSVTSENVNSLSANNIVLSTATTRYLAFTPSAFVHITSYALYTYTGQMGVIESAVNAVVEWGADVQLPHNAIVTNLIFYGQNPTTTAMNLNLIRSFNTQTVDTMGGLAWTTVTTGNTSTSIFTNATIDNANYSYLLDLRLGAKFQQFWGARIAYTITQPLP